MILKKSSCALVAIALLAVVPAGTAPSVMAVSACDPAFAALFTPKAPRLGRYEVCADPRPLLEVAPQGAFVEALEALDAFGGAGSYDRSRLAHLYGGARVRVARRWRDTAGRFESETFLSPYPNPALTALEAGTLVIRWTCEHEVEACKAPAAPSRERT